jgi:hypothetical protein
LHRGEVPDEPPLRQARDFPLTDGACPRAKVVPESSGDPFGLETPKKGGRCLANKRFKATSAWPLAAKRVRIRSPI